MRHFILTFILFSGLFANAQSWNNLNYNKHQHGLEENPLKGFATMWDVESQFPYSIQGKLFKFNDILTGFKQYDWTLVDNFIQAEALKGKHVYLQVNIDPVENQELYLPQYILNDLISKNDIVQITETKNGKTDTLVSPNWNNQVLVDAMEDFIIEFGLKYDNDPRVFMVHTGLYGMWGEWHIFPFEKNYSNLEMNTVNKNKIANAYTNSFSNTKLLARYPKSMPDPTKFGYSDGLTFEQSIGQPAYYFNNLLQNDGASQNWKTLPIGGEVSPLLQDTIFKQWPNITGNAVLFPHKNNATLPIQDITASISLTHSSWLFANYLFQKENNSNITQAEINNAMRVQKMLGYTFYLKRFKLNATSGLATIETDITNKGIAPMYANWDVEFAAIDNNGALQTLKTQKLGIDQILPGSNQINSITANTALADGNYTLVLRIKNPLETYSNEAPPVRFANETQDANIKGWLTLGNMTLVGGAVSQLNNTVAQSPYGGEHHTVPGTIEGEAYDLGGNGIAYQDDGNRVGNAADFRPYDQVDMVSKQTASNGYTIGYTQAGEWLEYTIDVAKAGHFDVAFQYFCGVNNPGDLKISLDGVELTTITNFSNGGWETAKTAVKNNVLIPAGNGQIMRLEYVNGTGFDIDALTFTPSILIQDGTYTIKSKSGSYLYAPNNTQVQNSNNLQGAATQWNFVHEGDNVYSIFSTAFPTKKIEVPHGHCEQQKVLGLTDYNGTHGHLRWQAIEEGNHIMFVPKHCQNNAMDIWSWNTAVVHLWGADANNDNQLFEVLPASSNKAALAHVEDQIENSSIAVYPNPVTDILNIDIPALNHTASIIKIFSVEGKLLHRQEAKEGLNQIQTNLLNASGLLIIQLINQHETKTFKLMKK